MSAVSRETADLLAIYEELLLKWNPRINLVSAASLRELRARHIEDSLQLVDLMSEHPRSWTDLGSGGGLPGLVVAASLHGDTALSLVESDARKVAFLRSAIREMGLSGTTVLNMRIETAPPQNAAVVSARALAPLDKLLGYVARHIASDGTALLPKGRGWRSEIDQAQQHWRFHYDALPSRTDPEAVVLRINGISRA